MAPPDLKKIFAIKLKPRQDSYFDQFSRILMVKVFMATATMTGISWLKDKVTCIVPKDHDTTKDFVSKACWINGLYVYRGLTPQQSSFYYGIPSDIANDGVNRYGVLCSTRGPNQEINSFCTGLERTFFLQYQWFPAGIMFLSFLYYVPYLLFKFVNSDLEALKSLVKGKSQKEANYDEIIDRFFNRNKIARKIQLWRIFFNILVKIMYVIVNVSGMLIVDSTFNSEFLGYGSSWIVWAGLSKEKMHDYTKKQDTKAGHHLLPGFGLCQVRSEAQDIKNQYTNVHTYICELSQHILYQYVLIILWFLLAIGIVVSIVGLLRHMFKYICLECFPGIEGEDVTRFYSKLSMRERELMDYIRLKNIPVFGELMERLQDYDSAKSSSRSSYIDGSMKKQRLS